MKFHITHVHTPESCPLAHTGASPVSDWKSRASEVGVTLHAAVADQVGHSLFFIVEADDVAKLNALLDPFLGCARAEVRPVRDLPQG